MPLLSERDRTYALGSVPGLIPELLSEFARGLHDDRKELGSNALGVLMRDIDVLRHCARTLYACCGGGERGWQRVADGFNNARIALLGRRLNKASDESCSSDSN